MVTVASGVPLMTSPVSLTFTLTIIAVVGAGDAVIVKVASVPSVTGEVPAEIVTAGFSGVGCCVVGGCWMGGGDGFSSSSTVTLTDAAVTLL